jgi:hypothetical protein
MQLRLKDQTSQTAAAADLLIGQEKRYRHCALGGEARQATLFRNGLGSGDARLIDMGPGWPTPKPSRSGTTAPERGLAEEQFCLEMETGTGKAYVLRLHQDPAGTGQALRLNQVHRRGAVGGHGEGVLKSFQITC